MVTERKLGAPTSSRCEGTSFPAWPGEQSRALSPKCPFATPSGLALCCSGLSPASSLSPPTSSSVRPSSDGRTCLVTRGVGAPHWQSPELVASLGAAGRARPRLLERTSSPPRILHSLHLTEVALLQVLLPGAAPDQPSPTAGPHSCSEVLVWLLDSSPLLWNGGSAALARCHYLYTY